MLFKRSGQLPKAMLLAVCMALSIVAPSHANTSCKGPLPCPQAFTWPNSDFRLDAAHGTRISLSPLNYYNLADGTPLILHWNIDNLIRVEQPEPGRYQLVFFDRRWNDPDDDIVPLIPGQIDFITGFNRYFPDYSDRIDSPQHAALFRDFFETNNSFTSLGSYLSSTTCANNPQSPHNLTGAGNSYPATVMDCCEIAHGCSAAMDSVLFSTTDDGRWYLDFANPDIVSSALEHVASIIDTQHTDSPFLFLDNGRYIGALWSERVACQMSYTTCLNQCRESDITCHSQCELIECADSRDTELYHPVAGSEFGIRDTDLYRYYTDLISSVNKRGKKAILNTAVLPALMGEHIEKNRLALFEQAIGDNGLAFEQEWHSSVRHSPMWVWQEISIYRRILSQGKLIVHYPDYDKPALQQWTAAMAMNIRESGQSLFLTRSSYNETPAWVHWPRLYGQPTKTMVFSTTCDSCMAQRGGYPGDWYVSREFSGGKITATHTNLSLTVEAFDNTDLAAADIPPTSANLGQLVARNLSGFTERTGGDYGEWTLGYHGSGLYRLDAQAIASHVGRVVFPSGGDPKVVKMEDFLSIGRGCKGEYCEDLIVNSVAITITIQRKSMP